MNKQFVNRKNELEFLEELFARDHGQLAVVYGRRRLGKTMLLRAFARDKPTVYFMADRGNAQGQRNALARAFASALDEPTFESATYDDWHALFTAFDRLRPADSHFVLILDEYQYLCQTDAAFSSYLQKHWDEHWSQQKLLLILCGSVTSMMHRETMAESSPLYGRADGILHITPLSFRHIPAFISTPDPVSQTDVVERYALCGGVPRYLELAKPHAKLSDVLKHVIINPMSPMYTEARNLLLDEVDVPNTAWSIMEAVSGGAHRISEIASRLALPANQLTRYIEVLRDMKILDREVPVAEKNPAKSKNGLYFMTDPFLGFWFRCFYPYESLFEFNNMAAGLKRIGPLLEQHVASCFEALCRVYARERMPQWNCIRIGRQWGRNYEIDIAGVNEDTQFTLFGECKWSTKPVGESVLRHLQTKVKERRLPVSPSPYWLLFSKSGFSKDLKTRAAMDDHLILVESIMA